MRIHDICLAYIGPETILPLTSILAAVIGVLLICWNFVVGFAKKLCRAVFGRKVPSTDAVSMETDAEE